MNIESNGLGEVLRLFDVRAGCIDVSGDKSDALATEGRVQVTLRGCPSVLVEFLSHLASDYEQDDSGFKFLGRDSVYLLASGDRSLLVFVDFLLGSRLFAMQIEEASCLEASDAVYEIDGKAAIKVAESLKEFIWWYLRDPTIILRK